MRVAIYVRTSSAHQAQRPTIAQQLDRLQAYIRTQGWSLAVDHIFRDDGDSGASLRRPGLDRLRDAVCNRELDCVLVTDPARLAPRSIHQLLLIDELLRAGCQVRFLDRPIARDPHDEVLFHILRAVAEYERTLQQ